MLSVFVRFMVPALAAAAILGGSTARAEEGRGAVLASTCFSCHGTGGHSAGAMPSIADKSADYIVDTLKRFRSGEKASTVMVRITKGFTDEEIEALANYFSASN